MPEWVTAKEIHQELLAKGKTVSLRTVQRAATTCQLQRLRPGKRDKGAPEIEVSRKEIEAILELRASRHGGYRGGGKKRNEPA